MKFDRVCVKRGGKRIVQNISFSTRPGSITCLVGRNGAGKTTILRAAAGLVPFDGEILYAEKCLSSCKPIDRARIVSFLSQSVTRPHVDVKRYITYGRNPYFRPMGIPGQSDIRIVEEAIEAFGLEALSGRDLASLSGGEFQRVRFALLAAQNTPVVLLDEPETHLDAEGHAELAGFVHRLRAKGKEVVCVLHDLTFAMEIADQMLILDDGSLAACGTPAEIARSETLEKYLHVSRFDAKKSDGSIASIYRA